MNYLATIEATFAHYLTEIRPELLPIFRRIAAIAAEQPNFSPRRGLGATCMLVAFGDPITPQLGVTRTSLNYMMSAIGDYESDRREVNWKRIRTHLYLFLRDETWMAGFISQFIKPTTIGYNPDYIRVHVDMYGARYDVSFKDLLANGRVRIHTNDDTIMWSGPEPQRSGEYDEPTLLAAPEWLPIGTRPTVLPIREGTTNPVGEYVRRFTNSFNLSGCQEIPSTINESYMSQLRDTVFGGYSRYHAPSGAEINFDDPTPTPTPEPMPEDITTYYTIQRPYGRASERTRSDLTDPEVRRREGIEQLFDGQWARQYEVSRVVRFNDEGEAEPCYALCDFNPNDMRWCYIGGGARRVLSGEPDESKYVTCPVGYAPSNTEYYIYPREEEMIPVFDLLTGGILEVPRCHIEDFSSSYASYVSLSGERMRCTNSGSSSYLSRVSYRGIERRTWPQTGGWEWVHSRHCPQCGTWHSVHNFQQEHLAARRHRSMDVVQQYHGHSTIMVHRALRPQPLSGFTIGFEVEKNQITNVDGSVARERGDRVDRTPLFSRWERDGSCGIEGITHAYSLERYSLFRSHVIRSQHLLEGGVSVLRDAQREQDSRRRYNCGGHITLNGPGVSIESVRRYGGLIYALYKKRLRNGYCSDNKDMTSRGQDLHYCAIRERGRDSVEFRLVRRVETHKNLLWRFRFFRHLAKAIHTGMSFDDYIRLNRPLLREVYKGNRLRDLLSDAKLFDDYLQRGIVHSRIAEYI